MSRSLAALTPATREKALRLIAAAPLVLGCELFIVHTYRSAEQQDALYLIGRDGPDDDRRVVTNAKGGESDHQDRTAFDVAFEEDGSQKPIWTGNWALLGLMGKAIGLEWGGDYKRLRDYGHFNLPT